MTTFVHHHASISWSSQRMVKASLRLHNRPRTSFSHGLSTQIALCKMIRGALFDALIGITDQQYAYTCPASHLGVDLDCVQLYCSLSQPTNSHSRGISHVPILLYRAKRRESIRDDHCVCCDCVRKITINNGMTGANIISSLKGLERGGSERSGTYVLHFPEKW